MSFDEKPNAGGKFSELYLQKASHSTASVNAGDYRLYVGGAHINLAFLNLLTKTTNPNDTLPEIKKMYGDMHRDMLKQELGKGMVWPSIPGSRTSIKGADRCRQNIGEVGARRSNLHRWMSEIS